MPRRRGKKMELLNETSESATASDAEVMESIEAHGEEFEGKTVLPLCKFIKRAAPDVDPPNISTYNCKLLTLDPLADKNGGENLLMLPQKGPFRLVGDFDVDGEHEDEKAIRRRITRNGGCATFSAIIVQYAIGMDPEPQLWARDIDNRAWLRIEPSISYKDVFDRAIQAATLVYGVLDLEDEFSEKKKVLDVNSVMYEYALRTGSGLSHSASKELFAGYAREMITHCFGDDVTKGRVISKFLRATFPHLYKDIYNICSSYKKLMDQIIKSLEGPEDEDDDEEVEDLTEVPSVFYPPDSVMELAVNVKLVQSAEKANLPCMPTPVVIYTYIVVHGIPNCPTILYRDWSIARPETARFMVIYWAPKILEFMTDQTTKAYLDLKSLSQVCKPEDRAEALAWVKKNNPEHKRGRLGHDSEVTSAQRKLIPGKKWMQEAIAYSLITHRQKPIHDWPNFTFLRDRTPSVQRIRTAKKIVSGETATLPAATPENDEDIVMEDVAPDLTMDTITSRSRPPSPYPEFKQRSTSNATVRNVSELKPAGKRAVLAPRQVLKDVRTREINRHGDGLVNENGKAKPQGRPRLSKKCTEATMSQTAEAGNSGKAEGSHPRSRNSRARKISIRKLKAGPSAPAKSSLRVPPSNSQPQLAGLQSPIASNEFLPGGFMLGVEGSEPSPSGFPPQGDSESIRLCLACLHPAQANSPPALDSDSSSTSSPSSSPPPNPIVADQTTADTIKFRPLPDGSYNCTVEGCAHIEYKPKTREGYQQMLDHYSTHVGQKVALVVGEQMRTGRTTGHLQQRIRRADLF